MSIPRTTLLTPFATSSGHSPHAICFFLDFFPPHSVPGLRTLITFLLAYQTPPRLSSLPYIHSSSSGSKYFVVYCILDCHAGRHSGSSFICSPPSSGACPSISLVQRGCYRLFVTLDYRVATSFIIIVWPARDKWNCQREKWRTW